VHAAERQAVSHYCHDMLDGVFARTIRRDDRDRLAAPW